MDRHIVDVPAPKNLIVRKMSERLPQEPIAVSIVIPLYNEREVFPLLNERIEATLEQLPQPVEVLLVDDGSEDETAAAIDRLVSHDRRFVGIHLSRNFGHQAALTAGMDLCRGEVVALIDGDLQDPPELLLEMYAKIQEGYDVVYAVRRSRKESFLYRVAYRVFYRLLKLATHLPIPVDSGDFGMMSRRVVDQINAMPEQHRFVRGLRSFAGFRQVGIPYDRGARLAGRPKFTPTRLVRLAADGIFTFSELPLRLASLLGVFIAFVSTIYMGYLLIWRMTTDRELPGFATLAVSIFFLASIQLICLGIVEEYIARIHSEVKRRPRYIIDRVALTSED